MQFKKSETHNVDFKLLFQACSGLYLILLPDTPRFTIVDASDAYLAATMTQREKIKGKNLFEVFPDNPADSSATGVANLTASLNRVLSMKKPDHMEIQKYDIPFPAPRYTHFEERYWRPINTPVMDDAGNIVYIIHEVEDVTNFVKLEKKEQSHEAALLDSNEKFSFILNTAHDAFIAMDVDGKITDWNPQAEATFGWSKSEVKGHTLSELIIPERLREAHNKGLRHFIATGEGPVLGKRIELPALNKAGTEFPIELTISAIKQKDTFLFSAFLRDISERKKTEKIQKVQLEFTRILTEYNSVTDVCTKTLEIMCNGFNWSWGAYWQLDRNQERFELNSCFHRNTDELKRFASQCWSIQIGKTEGLLGQVWQNGKLTWRRDIESETDFPREQHFLNASLHGAIAFPVLVDGEFSGVIEFLSQKIQEPDQQLREVMNDMATRFGFFIHRLSIQQKLKEMNENLEVEIAKRTGELRRSEKQLLLITDTLPVGVTYVDTDRRYRFVNETYAKWRRLSKEQIVGSSVSDFLDQKTNVKAKDIIRKVLSGKSDTTEMTVTYPDKTRIISISNYPDFDENGKVVGFISVSTDLSEQKQIEDYLKEAKQNAESASRAKSEFLANMSHEIRTPLGAVLGFADLIANAEITEAEKLNFSAAIKRNGELLTNIISDILDLSKVEVGKLHVELQTVFLENIISDIETHLRLLAGEKGLALDLQVDNSVPQLISTDPLRLRQILINIIGNAVKFTERGLVSVKVQLMNGKLAFLVKDTGQGISEEQASQLFQSFTQADSSIVRKFGGTGLGLVLSKHLAKLLGGDVELTESKLGKGSTFTITIDPGKVNRSEEIGLKQRRVSGTEVLPEINLAKIKILLVEDSVDNQKLISKILSLAGASYEIADNGAVAVEKMKSANFDMILMDLQMPVMDGYEATAEIRRLGFKQPIIALSAHAFKDVRARCLEVGFNEYISKPINRKELLERVSSLIKKMNS